MERIPISTVEKGQWSQKCTQYCEPYCTTKIISELNGDESELKGSELPTHNGQKSDTEPDFYKQQNIM
jgi:hypothetical protein